MNNIKISVVIPYWRRPHNLRLAFEALAAQTMDRDRFEVVVGAMEYAEDYVAACREFTDRLSIVSVLSADDFHIPRARNLGMRQARGEVVVQMDADTLLPPDALRNLYDRHFGFGQRACVVGQVIGYGNNDSDVGEVPPRPYAHYRAALGELAGAVLEPVDPRFQADHVIPWAFAWTGLIALPSALVREHDLYFDESFRGWGVDDLEWGLRISATGTPIVLRPDVYAMHLPHTRDRAANQRTEAANFRRFLRKWPKPEVELTHAFNDLEANRLYLGFRRELEAAAGGAGDRLGVVRGVAKGRDVLVLGVRLDARGRVADDDAQAVFDASTVQEVWPLAGLALPYDDDGVDECHLLPSLATFSPRYLDAVLAEAGRVGKSVVWAGGSRP